MMNVPLLVIIGKSPMKTVCSLISPVDEFMKRAVTNSGREKVMSFSRHSDSEYFGGSNSWSASSSLRVPVKSSIGEMSERTSATPSSRNQSNDLRWTAMRSGRGWTSRSLANEKRSRGAVRGTDTTPSAEQTGGDRRARWPGGGAGGPRREQHARAREGPGPAWMARAPAGRHGDR